MVTLVNDFLTVTVNERGAEITSIVDNHTKLEYIWQADPDVWGRHAPVLFPIVGALRSDTYTYNDKSFHMTQHGFARDRVFTVLETGDDYATFLLHDDEKTRSIYPFAFKFEITIALENNTVKVSYHVENPDPALPLYFSVGGHPGFRLPVSPGTKFDDYYLAFNPRKSLITIPLIAGQGIDYAHRTLAATDVNIQLAHKLFAKDAVIFALNGQTTFGVRSEKTKHGFEISVKDAPYMGVWSQYPTTGDFICLEPWWGIADTIDADGDLTHKLGINKLDPNGTFDHGYRIGIF